MEHMLGTHKVRCQHPSTAAAAGVRMGKTDKCRQLACIYTLVLQAPEPKPAKQAIAGALQLPRGQERLNCRASCPPAAPDASNKGRVVAKPR